MRILSDFLGFNDDFDSNENNLFKIKRFRIFLIFVSHNDVVVVIVYLTLGYFDILLLPLVPLL